MPLYYVSLFAVIDGEGFNIHTDIHAVNGAEAVMRVVQSLNNPDGHIQRLTVVCRPDYDGVTIK
jgi:hypothetical protein